MVWGAGRVVWSAVVAALVCAQPPPPPPEAAPAPAPCPANALCTCRPHRISCTAVPLHRFPEWSSFGLQHLDVSMSNLEVLTESALDGLRLQTLVLAANKLCHIEAKAFSSMSSSLASLDLGYNEFIEIPLVALRDLNILNWLNMQNNHIVEIPHGIHWHQLEESLTSISLSNNHLTHIKSGSFISLKRLVQLELDGNRLRSIEPDSLPHSLVFLKLADNVLHHVSCDILLQLPRLQGLDLRHNLLNVIQNNTCKINHTKKIEKIDLSDNDISDRSELDFFRKIHLKQLVLDFNELTIVPAFVYQHSRIEKLSISFNDLTSVFHDFFLALRHSLEELELEHNKLSRLPGSLKEANRLRHLSLAYNLFADAPLLPPHLQSLSLAGNFLMSLPEVLKTLAPESLRSLDLSYNKISSLLPDQFTDWASALVTINLKGNRLTQIYEGVFPETMAVKEVILSFNDLYFIHPYAFSNVSSSLQVLECSSTLFSGRLPLAADTNLENLSWITVDNNNIHMITSYDLHVFPSLEYLSLDYNKIIAIPVVTEDGNFTSSLKDLRLSYNFLTQINKELFTDMLDLHNLDLSFNKIANISSRTFKNLPRLVFLSLAGNMIGTIDKDAFTNLPSLQILELQENHLSSLSSDSFTNISSSGLSFTLNVSGNSIKHMSGSNQISVSIFDCSHNALMRIPKHFFSLSAFSIRQIILSDNKLSYIDTQAFGPLVNLDILNLKRNNITLIKRRALNELLSLQILDLSENQITQLAVEQFYNMKKLRYLTLSHNKLKSLPRDVFKNTHLEHVDVSHNVITIFPHLALAQIGFTLRLLDISHNEIEHLDSNMFQSIPFLLNLNLAGNSLTVLSDNTFSSIGGLRKLDISSNVVKANYKELFHNLPYLVYLNLANSGLRTMPHLPLSNLTYLNLTLNHISIIKESETKRLSNLRDLDLSFNRLTSLVPNMWVELKRLNHLDISYNPVVRITLNSFEGLSNLSSLKMHGLKHVDILERNCFRPLVSLRSLHIQSWSNSSYQKQHVAPLISVIPSLERLTLHIKDDNLTDHLHGISSKKLKHLEIRGSNLKYISEDAFKSMENNNELLLRITGTSISELPNGFMKHLGMIPHLGLDLSNNLLTSLSPAVFYPNITSWNHVATKLLSGGLVLSSNPLRCDCDITWLGAWLRRWLQESGGAGVAAPLSRAVRTATCRYLHTGAHVALLQLHTDEAECHASALSSEASISNISKALWLMLFLLLR